MRSKFSYSFFVPKWPLGLVFFLLYSCADDEASKKSLAKLAEEAYNTGDYSKSIEAYSNLIHDFPTNYEYYFKRGVSTLKKLDEPSPSRPDFWKCIQANYKKPESFFNLALTYPPDSGFYAIRFLDSAIFYRPDYQKAQELRSIFSDTTFPNTY